MKYMLKTFVLALVFFFFSHVSVFAQAPNPQQKEEVYKAEVVKVVSRGEVYIDQHKQNPYQTVLVKFLDGPNTGKEITVDNGKKSTIRPDQEVETGDKVVLLAMKTPKGTEYQIIDRYRLDWLFGIVIAFFVLVIGLCRMKGVGSIIGLCISLAVIVYFLIPQILAGRDPLMISIISSIAIMTTTIYLAHGFSRKTHIALGATCLSLLLTGFLAYFFVQLLQLNGLGSDDASSLRFGPTELINFKGLFLGGIIIGALGVLDDVTTSLSTVIEELKKANPTYTFWHLAKSAFKVGTEHITSLVNTLVLAYAGAGLPLFLFIIINPTQQPLWAILNSELIVEELVRTLAGSIGLILAVPITILIAALISSKYVPVSAQEGKHAKG